MIVSNVGKSCHSRLSFPKSFLDHALISNFGGSDRYFLNYVFGAPKLGGQSHSVIFCLIKIGKLNIDSRLENQILGVYVKSERIKFKAIR